MSEQISSSRIARLVEQAHQALQESRSRFEISAILERILSETEEGSDANAFAHHHLAEMVLEENPWQAASHLRNVVRSGHDTHVIHALLGLCYALLGHFHLAVASYRRALVHARDNPWYLHNLGHILDVGLLIPAEAESILRLAHSLEPLEDEITASLAHCLASLGQYKEALALAKEALELSPDNENHKELVQWVQGKRKVKNKHKRTSGTETGLDTTPSSPKRRHPKSKSVLALNIKRSES